MRARVGITICRARSIGKDGSYRGSRQCSETLCPRTHLAYSKLFARRGCDMGSPSLPLRGDYASLNDYDVACFPQVLEEGSSAFGVGGSAKQYSPKVNRKVLVDAPSLAAANEDWMKKYRGNSKVLLLPSNTQEVALILKHCNDRKLAMVPQGGNTGLVGGGVQVHDEVIVNLKNMNQMVSVDKNAGVLVAEAGVVLEDRLWWLLV